MRRFHCLQGLIPALLLVVGTAHAQDSASYGYVRTLEGSATVTRADTAEPTTLVINYPIQVGDLLQTDSYAAAELVLPDFNVVRLGAVADLELRELAFSADSDDRRTVLSLIRGEVQVVVTEHALGDELPRIETPNATIYVHEPGTYVIEYDGWERTRLVVRSGYAEALTERGSAVARGEQEIVVEGLAEPAVSVLAAGGPSTLEAWGERLAAGTAPADDGPVDPALGYSAAALEESGEWVEVEGAAAWRPRVEVGWRPFTSGTWVSTPSGLTWVGYEPWGWVTGHYGYWSSHPHWGWIWYPGFVYSPARVYWYWGSGWVGWVPTGYYGHHHGYRQRHFYGYAGGHWGYYRNWTFCPTKYFGYRKGHHHYTPGRALATRPGVPAVPRGVIATETSGITKVQWSDGRQVGEILAVRGGGAAASRDLTDFVSGREDLAQILGPTGGDRGRGSGVRDGRLAASRPQAWKSSGDRRPVVLRRSDSGTTSKAPPRRDTVSAVRRDPGRGTTPRLDTAKQSRDGDRQGWRGVSGRDSHADARQGWRSRSPDASSSTSTFRREPTRFGGDGSRQDLRPPARRVVDSLARRSLGGRVDRPRPSPQTRPEAGARPESGGRFVGPSRVDTRSGYDPPEEARGRFESRARPETRSRGSSSSTGRTVEKPAVKQRERLTESRRSEAKSSSSKSTARSSKSTAGASKSPARASKSSARASKPQRSTRAESAKQGRHGGSKAKGGSRSGSRSKPSRRDGSKG